MSKELSCFKAYDVRGELGVNFDSDICYVIGCAFAEIIDPKVVLRNNWVAVRKFTFNQPSFKYNCITGKLHNAVVKCNINIFPK